MLGFTVVWSAMQMARHSAVKQLYWWQSIKRASSTLPRHTPPHLCKLTLAATTLKMALQQTAAAKQTVCSLLISLRCSAERSCRV